MTLEWLLKGLLLQWFLPSLVGGFITIIGNRLKWPWFVTWIASILILAPWFVFIGE